MTTLLAALPDALRPDVHPGPHGDVVVIDHRAGTHVLVPVWIGEGFPRDARQALSRRDAADAGDHLVLVGRRLTPRTREELGVRGISWADGTGQARISTSSGLFIDRDHSPDSATMRVRDGEVASWSTSSGAVAEYLLDDLVDVRQHVHGDVTPVPRAAQLARDLGWSPQQVNKVLQHFDAMSWTEKVGPERGPSAHRLLTDPSGLLSAWAGWYRRHRSPTVGGHARWGNVWEFVDTTVVANLRGVEFALTSWPALDLIAPFATDIPTISLYLDAGVYDTHLEPVMAEMGLRRVSSGARVLFSRMQGPLPRRRVVQGLPVVGPVRLYGDLLRAGMRGEEAADHLRETVLGW